MKTAAKTRLIDAGWRQYAEHCLPANAPAIQVRECRRAFFSGAIAIFEALLDTVGDDNPRMTEEARMAIMRSVEDEAEQFFADVKAGRR